ncbi:MAG: mandelate racemase/muconate lactonizing enzyme family protein [Mycobacterium sp.]
MKITQIDTHIVSVPLATPWEMGIGTAYRRDELIVVVHTDEGLTGYGSSYHAHAAQAVKGVIDHKVAPVALGENPLAIQSVWEKCFYSSVYVGSAGVQALAGIDIALWDILGKYSGQSVATLLGGGGVEKMAAYVGCMSMGHKPLPDLQAEAKGYAEEGYKAIKVRGGAGFRADVEAMSAVRDAVGPDVDLMIDFNARYSWPEAVRLSKKLQEFDTFWIEDPFDFTITNHHDDVGRLRNMGLSPLSSGGNVYSRFDYRNLLERGGVDYITPDVVKSGGISETLKIAYMASANETVVALHTLNGLGQLANVHLAAAIPAHVRGYVEWDPTSPNELRDEMLTNPVRVEKGDLFVPTGPGLGTDLNMDFVKEFELKEGGVEIAGKPRGRYWNS